MTISVVPVKYTPYTTEVTTYETGITDWKDIELAYRNRELRNKVVCRIDVLQKLSVYFMPETINEFRAVFLYVMKGLCRDPEMFSTFVKEMLNRDERFRRTIHDIYNGCPEEISFGEHLINAFANVIMNAEAMYRSFFRGKSQVVICTSDGYLYFSTVDDAGEKLVLPEKVDCEVLSYAKNWRGDIYFIE